jgi:hypothetical protein
MPVNKVTKKDSPQKIDKKEGDNESDSDNESDVSEPK